MIVEFIGSSGAGKSSLATVLLDRGRPSGLVSAWDLVLDRPGRRWITHPKVKNLVADVTVLPAFLEARRRHPRFVRFASERLRNHGSTVARLNYLLNVERRVGMYQLARRAAHGRTILADEGALLIAYQLFVYVDAAFGQPEIERFAELVPMPDRIVYVRAPLDALVDRSIRRPDRRRELLGDPDEVERRAARSVDLFDGLAAVPAIRDRLLIVDNPDATPEERLARIARIEAFIGIGAVPAIPSSASPERGPG